MADRSEPEEPPGVRAGCLRHLGQRLAAHLGERRGGLQHQRRLVAPAAGTATERALLIDDDLDVAEALTAMLIKEGVRVEHAATASEGLALLAAKPWDAVFLDVRLPDLSGPEIYQRLAESNPALAQRVVFVTGGVWRSDSKLRQELPPQPVLPKPCTQDAVRAVLRQLRAQRRQAA